MTKVESDIGTLVRMCCVCRQVERRGIFYDLGEPINKYILENCSVTHTYCPDCYSTGTEKLQRARKPKQQKEYRGIHP